MHSISIFLTDKSSYIDYKIEVLTSNDSKDEIKFTKLGSNIYAFLDIPNFKEFGIGRKVAVIETDYFGGAGHQSAKLYVNNKRVHSSSDEYTTCNPINDVLKLMGVKRTIQYDEFDVVGLGKYRRNEDFK